MQSIHNQVETKIKSLKKGSILFIADFIEFGTAENVKKVLLRLEKKEVLIRLAHGIYLYPKKDKILGILFPSTEEIAVAIAKRDKARIISTGVQALQQLGLSTQVPMNVVYLTDGAPRKIKVGKRTITFKKTTPKNLTIKDKKLNIVIQGLKELGKNNIDENAKQKIKKVLQQMTIESIKEDSVSAPTWIRNTILELINEN
jgi:predicted transcriptional regulator of viral defense system